MALTNVRSDLLSQIGLQPPFAFDLMRRDEVSRTPNGQSITTELGWPLWKLAFTTSERNFGDVVRQQAILNHLASVGNLFYAHDVRRPFPGAYPSGFDLANPIYNPEFEDGLTGWVVSADCQITNDGRGGSKCVQLDKLLASGGSDRRVQNDAGFYVNVTANEPYDFSVYIKSNVETTTGIRLAVNFYDVSGTYISQSGNSATAATPDYVQKVRRVTTPPNAALAQVIVALTASASCRYLYVDSISYLPTYAGFSGVAKIHTLDANNKSLRLKNTISGYKVSVGDYLAFNYGGGRRALHQALEDVVADSNGTTPFFDVMPFIRPGAAVDANVDLVKATALFRMDPGSLQSQLATKMSGNHSFSATQFVGQP